MLVSAGIACGGSQRTSDGNLANAAPREPSPSSDTRTPIEQRRDAACDQLGPKLTACAVEDAKADLTAGKITRSQFDSDTAPAVQRKNTDEFLRACKAKAYSSRQIRVLEVCFRDAPACSALVDCLGHLNDEATTRPKP